LRGTEGLRRGAAAGHRLVQLGRAEPQQLGDADAVDGVVVLAILLAHPTLRGDRQAACGILLELQRAAVGQVEHRQDGGHRLGLGRDALGGEGGGEQGGRQQGKLERMRVHGKYSRGADQGLADAVRSRIDRLIAFASRSIDPDGMLL
jgi:hypothetical protein